MTFPECGLCEGMRVCNCKSETIDKRFISACYAMQGFISSGISDFNETIAAASVKIADALIAELEKK